MQRSTLTWLLAAATLTASGCNSFALGWRNVVQSETGEVVRVLRFASRDRPPVAPDAVAVRFAPGFQLTDPSEPPREDPRAPAERMAIIALIETERTAPDHEGATLGLRRAAAELGAHAITSVRYRLVLDASYRGGGRIRSWIYSCVARADSSAASVADPEVP